MRSVAHGYFAYVNKISFAYPEQSVHKGVTGEMASANIFLGGRNDMLLGYHQS